MFASTASFIGKIASGLEAAIAATGPGLKRSIRVGVAPETETSSPRSSPTAEDFVWRPVMPGYVGGVPLTVVQQKTVEIKQTESTRSRDDDDDDDDGLKQTIPVMPLPVAVVCCMLNVVSPGLG